MKKIEITPRMIEAGIDAWGCESTFYGPPHVEGEPVVRAIFEAMIAAMTDISRGTSQT